MISSTVISNTELNIYFGSFLSTFTDIHRATAMMVLTYKVINGLSVIWFGFQNITSIVDERSLLNLRKDTPFRLKYLRPEDDFYQVTFQASACDYSAAKFIIKATLGFLDHQKKQHEDQHYFFNASSLFVLYD